MRPLRLRACTKLLPFFAALAGTACGHDSDGDAEHDAHGGLEDAGLGNDAAPPDAAAPDPAAHCAVECADGAPPAPDATCFGDALTDGFGRIDGTLLAVQGPSDTDCALPNDDHLIVQVLMGVAAYRMVVNILSDGRNGTDTSLRFADVAAPLPAPAWQEGWHLDAPLDFVGTLGVHDDEFTPVPMGELVQQITSALTVGAPISVYATSDGRPESAHLVHRNRRDQDGAIVVDPTGDAPHFLLLHFDGQTF